MQIFIQSLVGGLGWGAVYVLVALGFSLVYRTMGLVNFAHGDVIMIGAFLASTFNLTFVLPFPLAVLITIAITAVLALVIERVLRPLENKDFDLMLIGTIGFGTVLQALAAIIWGREGVSIPYPTGNAAWAIGDIKINPYAVVVVIVAAVVTAILAWFIARSKPGIAMQAVALDFEQASAVGVNVGRSNAIAFSIGGILAAIAGSLAGPMSYVNPTFGSSLGIFGFAAAVLGGLGSIQGAIVGGLVFGVLQGFAQTLFQGYYQLALFIVFALIVIVKPSGIFGEQRVDRA